MHCVPSHDEHLPPLAFITVQNGHSQLNLRRYDMWYANPSMSLLQTSGIKLLANYLRARQSQLFIRVVAFHLPPVLHMKKIISLMGQIRSFRDHRSAENSPTQV